MFSKILLLSLILLGFIHESHSFCEAMWTSNISSDYSSSIDLSEPGNAISSLSFTGFGIRGLLLKGHPDLWYLNMYLYIWMGVTSFLHHYYFYNADWAMYSDVVTLQILTPMALYQIVSVIKDSYYLLYTFIGIFLVTLPIISLMVLYLLGMGNRHEIIMGIMATIIFTQFLTVLYFFREKHYEKWNIFKVLFFSGFLFGTAVIMWYVDSDCPKWMMSTFNGHSIWHIGIAWSLFSTLNISNLLSITLSKKDYCWVTPFPKIKWMLFTIKMINTPAEIEVLVQNNTELKTLTKKLSHRRASSWT